MDLVNEIRDYFAAKIEGYTPLESLPPEYEAFAMRTEGMFGVAIPYDNTLAVAERFSGAQLHTRTRVLGNDPGRTFLELTSTYDALRNEFATLCAQFVSPGLRGVDRKALINDPLSWWNNWRQLLGNTVREKAAYSVIAEMIVLYKLYRNNKEIRWAAADNVGTQDIEDAENSYEVKSTLKKSGVEITISSLSQLKKDTQKRLYLYFCRMEESVQGISINDMTEKLIKAGYDGVLLEKELMKIGYEYGCSARNDKYKFVEGRKYIVDKEFPAITEKSFIGGNKPEFLISFTYTITLNDIPFEEWNYRSEEE